MFSKRLPVLLRNQVKHISKSRRYSTESRVILSPFPDITSPDIPLQRYVLEHFQKWPNHTAIECAISGKKYSYSELHAKCNRFASSLLKCGLKKGEIIAIILPNTPEFAVAYLGALEAGLTASTINPGYTIEEVVHQLKDCKAEWIICHPSTLPVVIGARNHLKNLKVICTNDLDGSSPRVDSNVVLFEDMICDSIEMLDSSDDRDLSELALIAYSSGTTGLPKGTCLNHRSIATNLEQIGTPYTTKFIETHGDHQDISPAILPFFHAFGNIVVLLQGLRFGAKIITLPKFDTNMFISTLEKNKNLILFLVPPVIFLLGNSKDVKEKQLRGIREILTGAAPCSPHDLAKLKQKNVKMRIAQGYGLTEASPVLTSYTPNGTTGDNMATVGPLLPNTSAKTISLDNGDTLTHNEIGELLFKGPQIMAGYLNNPEATARTVDSEGWLHTGDVGYYDQDGYFYITDRLKELIKVKGLQVAPAELEEVLRQHPGILEAGVVGVPNERTGEVPVAFVQTVPGYRVTEQEIKDFLASHLSKHKHLSSVQFLPAIPKTASGKILRRQLKTMV